MSDGATVRELDLGEGAAVDRGKPHVRLSELRSPPRQSSPMPRASHEFAENVGTPVRTSRMTDASIRALDIIGSLAGLVVASPLILLAMLLIRITAGKPVLYRQERVGLWGKRFLLYKFRTMINDAEKDLGPVLASRDDERITRIGRILRKTRFDEVPQLYNILRGDMSLVGPRPERPFFVDRHKALRGTRLAVRPGLTGLAQIRGLYDLKPAHKVRYDHLYIQKRCLLLNIYIILRTIPALFTRVGW